jgi:galactitol-specific phosphotransferase system IIB component
MKILYILRQKSADDTVKKLIEEHKKTNEVKVININENKNYDEIVDLITSSDKVISW